MITAFCDRNGVIEFSAGQRIPKGMLPMAKGPAKPVRDLIRGTARLAYDNKTYLVPGIPEADSDAAAYDAYVRYKHWIKKTPISGVTVY